MTISAKIIKDSVGPNGARITTFVLRYPRFIHAEFLTHRMFSRNASSSRAIPFKRQIRMIKEDLAMPVAWGLNQKGMQAYTTASGIKATLGKLIWKAASRAAIFFASTLNMLGFHKQIVNRIIEPFSHITVVVTSTDYNNFFKLRYHHAAQPEIYELAKQMFKEYFLSIPKELKKGEFHLPFIEYKEIQNYILDCLHAQDIMETEEVDYEKAKQLAYISALQVSVARCARVSYNNHDGTASDIRKDFALYDRLITSQPAHSSPAEHQAIALDDNRQCGNFKGWLQNRKALEHYHNKNIEEEFYPNRLKNAEKSTT